MRKVLIGTIHGLPCAIYGSALCAINLGIDPSTNVSLTLVVVNSLSRYGPSWLVREIFEIQVEGRPSQ